MPRRTMCRELQPLWKITNLCLFAWPALTQLMETSRVPHPPHDYLKHAVVFMGLVCHLCLPQLATTALTTILQWFQSLRQNTLLRAYARSFLTNSNVDSLGRDIFDHYVSALVLDIVDALVSTHSHPSDDVSGPSAPPMSLEYVPPTKAQSVMRNMVACVAREVFMFMLRWLLRSLGCCSSQQQNVPQTQQQTETSGGGNAGDQGSEDGGTEQNEYGRDSGNGGNDQRGNGSDAGDGRKEEGNNEPGSEEDEEEQGDNDMDEDGNNGSGSEGDEEEEGDDEGYGGSEEEDTDEQEEGNKDEDDDDHKNEDAEAEAEAEAADQDDGGVSISIRNSTSNTNTSAVNDQQSDQPEQPERFRFIPRDHLGRRNAWDWTNIPTMPDPNTAYLLRRARRVCRHRQTQDRTDGRQG